MPKKSNRPIISKTLDLVIHQDALLDVIARDLKRLARKASKSGLHHIADQIKRVG